MEDSLKDYRIIYKINRFIKKKQGKLEDWIIENGEFTGHSYIYEDDELFYDKDGKLNISKVTNKKREIPEYLSFKRINNTWYAVVKGNDECDDQAFSILDSLIMITVLVCTILCLIPLIIKDKIIKLWKKIWKS